MSAKATLDKLTHSYTASDGNRVSLCVSDVLRLAGIVQPYPDVAKLFVEHARELGETVHEWCDYMDEGAIDVESLADSEILPYVLAYQRFREDEHPAWQHIEQSLHSDLGFAGTLDRVGYLSKTDKEVILDIKTPRKAEAHWGIQLSAYQILTGRSECALYALLLASDATYRLIPYKAEPEVFLAALKVAQWKVANGKVK
jgi:hypothetical protein